METLHLWRFMALSTREFSRGESERRLQPTRRMWSESYTPWIREFST